MVNEVVFTGRAPAKRERRCLAQISLSTQAQFFRRLFFSKYPRAARLPGLARRRSQGKFEPWWPISKRPPPRSESPTFSTVVFACVACLRRWLLLFCRFGCPQDLRSGRSMWRCQRRSGASPEAKAQDGPRPAVPSQATTIGGLCFQSIPLRASQVAHRIVRERRRAKHCPAHAPMHMGVCSRRLARPGSQRSAVVV